MTQQPATMMNSLIRQINNARETGSLTASSLAAFEDEARKLRSVNIAEGDMVLGIIAAHRGDVEEMRKRFKNAKAFNAPQFVVDCNYGLALFICGDFSGAIQVLSPFMDKEKDIATIVACACKYLGLEAKARQIFNSIDGANPEHEKEPDELILNRISFIAPALQEVESSFAVDKKIWQSLSRR